MLYLQTLWHRAAALSHEKLRLFTEGLSSDAHLALGWHLAVNAVGPHLPIPECGPDSYPWIWAGASDKKAKRLSPSTELPSHHHLVLGSQNTPRPHYIMEWVFWTPYQVLSQIPHVLSVVGLQREAQEASLGPMFSHSHTHNAPKAE